MLPRSRRDSPKHTAGVQVGNEPIAELGLATRPTLRESVCGAARIQLDEWHHNGECVMTHTAARGMTSSVADFLRGAPWTPALRLGKSRGDSRADGSVQTLDACLGRR